jgi:hypothetical protein
MKHRGTIESLTFKEEDGSLYNHSTNAGSSVLYGCIFQSQTQSKTVIRSVPVSTFMELIKFINQICSDDKLDDQQKKLRFDDLLSKQNIASDDQFGKLLV